ncbi:3-isopropylmalate dehydratase large subunit [Candidatus Bathyarchaeota archaeon]|jgi:3-isopropylmalate/(R)-2-methylmalate dehydratase large subunit|nr:3-isopropylmalate dehydratase large subunit [Candidatus Bathyarchaeota archaeon]MBT4321484.1 3-isopropylmalate dehydratase large subunit [Candidatus Bathyarchaeota archaeon]MBT4424244.1 3-isopropylmalate dehydratase large subunit [Candidatus Bathyarchaeota archaeon]MBT7346769.1 3-isopropylmalate dehydratase large subunit [Candidatus Bathyarchaeota archaeon]
MSTVAQKILASHSGRDTVNPGEIVKADIDFAFMPALTAALAFHAMYDMDIKKVFDPEKVTILLDHIAPATNIQNATLHKECREIAKAQNFKHFYDINSGVCHQIIPENGHVYPGMLMVGADSHTCTHGAFGAFSTGIGSTDMGAAIGTGKLWFKVPETVKIQADGSLGDRVMSKDVILNAAKQLGADGATYAALEFHGSTVKEMSIGARMTMCNMAIELGGKTGICEPDYKTFKFLEGRVKHDYTPVYSDPDAKYWKSINVDSDNLAPQVACPHAVDNVKDVGEVTGKAINQVFIGSCTNGRLEDLRVAAEILKGKKICSDVRVIATPASPEVYKAANTEGLITTLMDAGAVLCNPSCSVCFGGNHGILAPGEVSLATSNRNFRGRQGSTEAFVYLASPATAAASALTGVITDPREV